MLDLSELQARPLLRLRLVEAARQGEITRLALALQRCRDGARAADLKDAAEDLRGARRGVREFSMALSRPQRASGGAHAGLWAHGGRWTAGGGGGGGEVRTMSTIKPPCATAASCAWYEVRDIMSAGKPGARKPRSTAIQPTAASMQTRPKEQDSNSTSSAGCRSCSSSYGELTLQPGEASRRKLERRNTFLPCLSSASRIHAMCSAGVSKGPSS